jgi:hypothetical protein
VRGAPRRTQRHRACLRRGAPLPGRGGAPPPPGAAHRAAPIDAARTISDPSEGAALDLCHVHEPRAQRGQHGAAPPRALNAGTFHAGPSGRRHAGRAQGRAAGLQGPDAHCDLKPPPTAWRFFRRVPIVAPGATRWRAPSARRRPGAHRLVEQGGAPAPLPAPCAAGPGAALGGGRAPSAGSLLRRRCAPTCRAMRFVDDADAALAGADVCRGLRRRRPGARAHRLRPGGEVPVASRPAARV